MMHQFKQTLEMKWKVPSFDFLINNAGMGATISFAEATEAGFDQFMNVHFKSVYFLTQQIVVSLPKMMKPVTLM